jgi:Protein of unknown function (DUF2844)
MPTHCGGMSEKADRLRERRAGVNQTIVILFQTSKYGELMQSASSGKTAKRCTLASALLSGALVPCIAAAALGEPETSVQSDTAELRGSIKVAERAGYRLHEIQLPSGTLVREFVGSDGNVFAVAWSGPTMPNLRTFLGRYFDSYVTEAKAHHSRHRQVQIHRDDLVVQAAGHMRAFSGLAYLPPAVPGGVSIGNLN